MKPDRQRNWSTAARIVPLSLVPPRVRCPQCARPILLATWWWHFCERAIVNREDALVDYELT